ncbi:MAG TPA: hypothetical protein VMM76_16205 [Pirellulaceae bacterium]|nr:hypothetical protein [Pirellulaceae bacterium]
MKSAPFRRYLRFSLRGLFVFVTALAIWLGLECKRVRDQRMAIARVTELGGAIAYGPRGRSPGADTEQVGWPWLRKLVGEDYFRDVWKVGLDGTNVTDADLLFTMARLRRVQQLSLNFTDVSDEGLLSLRKARQLRYLGLAETRVTDAALRYVAQCGNLETLILHDTAVGDEGVEQLQHLSQLRLLNVAGTSVGSDGIRALAGLENLNSLWANDTFLDDLSLGHFSRMDQLEELLVAGTRFSGEGLLKLQQVLPSCNVQCEVFDLSGNARCTAKWTKYVERIQALDDEKRLKVLNLSNTDLGDEHIELLHDLKHVEVIDLRGSNVSRSACDRLRSIRRDCRVYNGRLRKGTTEQWDQREGSAQSGVNATPSPRSPSSQTLTSRKLP